MDFQKRHVGPNSEDIESMLSTLGLESLDQLCAKAIPPDILEKNLNFKIPATSEHSALEEIKAKLGLNKVPKKCFIGKGFYGTLTPTVVSKVILQNPAWYTAYTPYQAEISQGRLEFLFYFQTMICELTGLDVANASLLDEASATAEAMLLSYREDRAKRDTYLVDENTHKQIIEVLKRRAEPLEIEIRLFSQQEALDKKLLEGCFGGLFSYPGTNGEIYVNESLIQNMKNEKLVLTMLCDPLALCLLKEPEKFGFDIAVGSCQRLGTAPFFGGPHAAFFAVKDHLKRKIPGRLVGLSKNRRGEDAYRLTLQTREQHIRRDKATSNICTSQVLLALINTAYAIYHGPKGLISIAEKIRGLCASFHKSLQLGKSFSPVNKDFFDTVTIQSQSNYELEQAVKRLDESNIAAFVDQGKKQIAFSFDETHSDADVGELLKLLNIESETSQDKISEVSQSYKRSSFFLSHPVFNENQSETSFMRYVRSLEEKDLSLVHSMIPLGSCTMKLNSASSLSPLSWTENCNVHPFLKAESVKGHLEIIKDLEKWLAELTAFDAVSMQPNSGAQGEYAGYFVLEIITFLGAISLGKNASYLSQPTEPIPLLPN